MKLLTEIIEEGVEMISEGTGENRRHFIAGPFLLMEEKNRNNRIYPKSVMRPAVEKYILEYVKPGRALGELNHPESPTVQLDRAVLLTTSLSENGNYFDGKAKILTGTPVGKIAISLMEDGVKLGVSSRATGTVKKDSGGTTIVSENLRFHAIDMVSDPSAHNAFVDMVMENVDWQLDSSGNWKAIKVAEEIKNVGNRSAKLLKENSTQLFQKFLESLGKGPEKQNPDLAYLTKRDLKILSEIAHPYIKSKKERIYIAARKHMAGVEFNKEEFDYLAEEIMSGKLIVEGPTNDPSYLMNEVFYGLKSVDNAQTVNLHKLISEEVVPELDSKQLEDLNSKRIIVETFNKLNSSGHPISAQAYIKLAAMARHRPNAAQALNTIHAAISTKQNS